MIDGPYRETKFVICPRCGELLERAFDDVLACLRCDGIWITPPSIAMAFGDPAWPKDARGMWWRNALTCPECSRDGTPTTLSAQLCDGVQIDRCAIHGAWLDRGELNRLAGTTGDELAELRRRLRGDGDALDRIAQIRAAWRRDLDARRHAAEEYETLIADETARKIAAAEQRERDATARAALDRQTRERLERERDARNSVREDLLGNRANVVKEVDTVERELLQLRARLRETEARLEGERMKLRSLEEQIADLDAARA